MDTLADRLMKAMEGLTKALHDTSLRDDEHAARLRAQEAMLRSVNEDHAQRMSELAAEQIRCVNERTEAQADEQTLVFFAAHIAGAGGEYGRSFNAVTVFARADEMLAELKRRRALAKKATE
jgi:hypothetical protein